MLSAVLTGDVVNSTLLPPSEEKKLLTILGNLLNHLPHEFFRGDSFQALVEDSRLALKTALLCRTAAISLVPENTIVETDVRISIGIGEVVQPVKELATAKGDAFLLSGRALDNLDKTAGRLVIVTENKLAAISLGVISDYINSIYGQLTPKQAEVIFELLQGQNQQHVAEKLNRSKSTISQHVTAGRWEEIEKILGQYEQIVELISL